MPLFFKTIGYCFYCSFYCFLILGGQKSFSGEGIPCPPGSRKPPRKDRILFSMEGDLGHFWVINFYRSKMQHMFVYVDIS